MKRIMFVSRGRGRGHALPDIDIAKKIMSLDNDCSITFASYATGADCIRSAGLSLIDMDMPEDAPVVLSICRSFMAARIFQPDFIVTHEEFGALPASHLAGVPSILLTDWWPHVSHPAYHCLPWARTVMFMGDRGVFPLPPLMNEQKLVYIAPVVPEKKYSRTDRDRARVELAINRGSFIISVIPGAWATEARNPISDLVLAAFVKVKMADKKLIWVTKLDHELIAERAAAIDDVMVLSQVHSIDQVIAASDVIITKGNRGTIMDASSIGISSISLSIGLNPIDETLVSRIPSNFALNAKGIDADFLAGSIEKLAARPIPLPTNLHLHSVREAAAAILSEAKRLQSVSSRHSD